MDGSGGSDGAVAGPSALSHQRAILGAEPLAWLFEQGTHVLCTPETEGAWSRGYRLMALSLEAEQRLAKVKLIDFFAARQPQCA